VRDLQIELPEGYETRLLRDGRVLVYGPEDVRDPETNEWLGRRTLVSFLPQFPGITEEVELLANLDHFFQREHLYEPEVVANLRREFEVTLEFWSGRDARILGHSRIPAPASADSRT
jgi:hypothetical protein